MKLLIGCPIYKREWCFINWYEAARISASIAGYKPDDIGFIYVTDRSDVKMKRYIQAHTYDHRDFITVDQTCASEERQWNKTRYDEMVFLRNELLKEVRNQAPDLFLSLDSDILLHPLAISNMVDTLSGWNLLSSGPQYGAVGGKTFMTERGEDWPSYANLNNAGALMRSNTDGVIQVQILMAIKLMTPVAYNVDYEYNDKGEDIGWSLACAERGLKLIFDGRVGNKHLMNLEMLDKVDERVGF